MGPFTNITHYSPHIIQLGFSQKYSSYYYQIGPQNYIIPTQSPTSFDLWAKPKENPKFQKSHYDVANSKFHYNVANSKSPTTMWLIPSPLRCGTIYKARCYMAILNHFYKAQIPIWHLFSQRPNSNLTLLCKAQILFWQLSLHSFIKPKY